MTIGSPELLTKRLREVWDTIAAAAARAGRSDAGVTLVAVTKTWPAELVVEAIAAGVTDAGENRAQEFAQKVPLVSGPVRWHFIGPLQTNKVRRVVGLAEMIHSVDRFGLAEAISRRALALEVTQAVLIEVNIARDPSKHGIDPERAVDLAAEVAALGSIVVKGLMTIPPLPEDPADSRPHFRALTELSARLQQVVPEATELSMGMSRDYAVAVEEGATLVRVGEAIFGPRA